MSVSSQTHITANFDKHSRITPKTHTEAYEALKKEIDLMKDSANLMKRQINSGSLSQAVSVVRQVIGGGSSSSSSVASSIQLRSRTVAFVANVPLVVVFSSPIAGTFALASLRILDSSGAAVQDFTISAITANGFTFLCPVAGTLTYLAVVEV